MENGLYEACNRLDGERLLLRPFYLTIVRLERSGDHDKAHLTTLLQRERAAGSDS